MKWFTSDSHYNHKNICLGTSNWPDKQTACRPFSSLEQMNDAIVNAINEKVKENDTLYFLGDWAFGGIESIWNFYKRIICKNIIFIKGNHDTHIIKNKVLPNCKRLNPYSLNIVDGVPIGGEYPDYVEAQTLFREVHDYLEITIDKVNVVLCHYPIEEWNDRHGKSIHLHGHQHGKNRKIENRLDIGIDNAFKRWANFYPFSWEDVKKIINENNRYIRHTRKT